MSLEYKDTQQKRSSSTSISHSCSSLNHPMRLAPVLLASSSTNSHHDILSHPLLKLSLIQCSPDHTPHPHSPTSYAHYISHSHSYFPHLLTLPHMLITSPTPLIQCLCLNHPMLLEGKLEQCCTPPHPLSLQC